MVPVEIRHELTRLVGVPAAQEQIGEATDRLGTARPKLRSEPVGLFRLGGEVVRRQEIGRGRGVVRLLSMGVAKTVS